MARANERTSFHLAVRAGAMEALQALVAHMVALAAEADSSAVVFGGKEICRVPEPFS